MLGYFHCISCVPPRRFRRQLGPTEKGTVNLDYLNNYCISTRHVRQLPWKINRGVSGFTADQIVRWGFRMDAVVIPYPMATWLYGRRKRENSYRGFFSPKYVLSCFLAWGPSMAAMLVLRDNYWPLLYPRQACRERRRATAQPLTDGSFLPPARDGCIFPLFK